MGEVWNPLMQHARRSGAVFNITHKLDGGNAELESVSVFELRHKKLVKSKIISCYSTSSQRPHRRVLPLTNHVESCFLGPTLVCPDTASRLAHPLLHGTLRVRDHCTCDICSSSPHLCTVCRLARTDNTSASGAS